MINFDIFLTEMNEDDARRLTKLFDFFKILVQKA